MLSPFIYFLNVLRIWPFHFIIHSKKIQKDDAFKIIRKGLINIFFHEEKLVVKYMVIFFSTD